MSYVVWQLVRQLVYQICYTRYQIFFYLWWIGSVIKYFKVPKYYDLDCRCTSPGVTKVFHAWPYGRFIDLQSNIRRNKLHRTNQSSNFLGGSFSNRDNVSAPIQFRRKNQKLKDEFSSRTDPFIFTSIAPMLLDWPNETRWVFSALKSTSHFLHQSTVSHRSDSNSEANSSCCHRSDAWSNLE